LSIFRHLYEHHMLLWHLAGNERSGLDLESAEWELLFHKGDWLAGWCTQMIANTAIRQDEIPQLVAFPRLDENGPYAAWLAEIAVSKRHLFAYVSSLEIIRLALLREIGRQA